MRSSVKELGRFNFYRPREEQTHSACVCFGSQCMTRSETVSRQLTRNLLNQFVLG